MSDSMELFKHTGATFTARSGVFDGMNFDEWAKAGRRLCEVGGAVQWWIGDWAVYGARTFIPNGEGSAKTQAHERYLFAVEATGYDLQTLRNFTYVARA